MVTQQDLIDLKAKQSAELKALRKSLRTSKTDTTIADVKMALETAVTAIVLTSETASGKVCSRLFCKMLTVKGQRVFAVKVKLAKHSKATGMTVEPGTPATDAVEPESLSANKLRKKSAS